MGDTARRNNSDTRILVISLGWVCLWILVRAARGDWLSGELSLLALPVLASGIIIFAIAVARFVLSRTGKRARRKAPAAMGLLTLGFLLGLLLPTRPAVVFHLSRDEFVRLAEEAAESRRSGRDMEIPQGPQYRSASAYSAPSSDAMVIEFIVRDFYLPLVYVSTDRPQDVYDTCSAGGYPVKRLAPGWYVCRRDWN
jgi:hypothetical protein